MIPSPWLEIPLADYEAHMAHASVGQAGFLADTLDASVEKHVPASIAIVGCAGGNGLDRERVKGVGRIVGVDINPGYIEEARRRYAPVLHGLELHCVDVESDALEFEPVDLVYAALLFEHVETASTLRSLRRVCRAGGVLVTVLQAPQESHAPVSPSPYASLQKLASTMKLVEPDELCRCAADVGFSLESRATHKLPTGRLFSVQTFRTIA